MRLLVVRLVNLKGKIYYMVARPGGLKGKIYRMVVKTALFYDSEYWQIKRTKFKDCR